MHAVRRSQTAMEYVFLVAGALFFVTFIIMALRWGPFSQTTHKIGADTNNYLNSTKNYLFFDNFDTGQSSRWTNYSGNCNVTDRKYVCENAGVILTGVTLSNFSYNVWMKSASSAGIVFGAETENTYYLVTVDAGLAKLESITLGAPSLIGNNLFPTGIASGVTLNVTVVGDSVEIYANGVSGGSYTIPAGVFRDRGLFGLASGNTGAEFDNVRICAQSC